MMPSAFKLLLAGRIAAALSVLLCLLVQFVNHDFFPPTVSVSQYGLGPRGWVFTCWTAAVTAAVLALGAGGSVRGARYWLAAGGASLLVMGIVRTDANGLQQSVHARVHMAVSVVALVALPVGMALAMSHASTRWRIASWTLVVSSAVSLILVLISAAGISNLGLAAHRSWALWQSVAITVDMVLLLFLALSSFPSQLERSRKLSSRLSSEGHLR